MAVVDRMPETARLAVGARSSRLLSDGLGAIDGQLRAASDLLRRPGHDLGSGPGALTRLRAVEDSLLDLACAVTTEPQVAGPLVHLRDDLSSYLLTALVLAEAGTRCEASEGILRRAVETTSAGLRAIRGPGPGPPSA